MLTRSPTPAAVAACGSENWSAGKYATSSTFVTPLRGFSPNQLMEQARAPRAERFATWPRHGSTS